MAEPEKDKSTKVVEANRVVWHFVYQIVANTPSKSLAMVLAGSAILKAIRKAGVDIKAKVSDLWTPNDGLVNEADVLAIETTSEQRLLLRRVLSGYLKVGPLVQGVLLAGLLLDLGGEFEGEG